MARLLSLLIRHWKPLLGLNILIFVGIIAGKLLTYEPVWQADAKLVVPDTTSDLDADLGPLGSLSTNNPEFSNQVNPLKLQISILTSDIVIEQVLAQDPQKEKFLSLTSYKKLFDISPEEQSTTIEIVATSPDPTLAQQRVQWLLQAYQARLNQLRTSESSARGDFNQDKVSQAKADLEAVQSELAQFQQASGLVNADVQTAELVKLINSLEAQFIDTQATAQINADQVEALSARLVLTPDQAVQALGLNENENYQLVRTQLATLSVALAEAEAEFTPASPQVQLAQRRRDEVAAELQRYLNQVNIPSSLDLSLTSGAEGRSELIQQMVLADSLAAAQLNQAAQLQTKIGQLNNTLSSVPEAQARLLELQQRYDVAEGIYKGLVAQSQQSNISAFSAYPSIQVLDPPRVDPEPIGPNLKLAIVNALLAAIVFSAALLLLLEGRDPLLSPKDLETMKFDFISRIPRFKANFAKPVPDKDQEDLVELQWLASTISAQSLANRTLLVTSAVEEEGKTAITIGLAKALVNLGYKVLIIDTDVYRQELSQRLGVKLFNLPGRETVDVQPNLSLKALSADKRSLKDEFTYLWSHQQSHRQYDYILVDSPPFTTSSEAAFMSQLIGNVLFVVRPDLSSRNRVYQSLDQLGQYSIKLLGLVINYDQAQTMPYSPTRTVNEPASVANK
ncbi:P-loop NTPase [Leptolyngbya sp. BC1307]|uniref:exopolysaccharide transport family protein n=1 Tax=Leptolyngbya sp. BC1307 TaxID=2029589 RepID=UPI000EFBDDC0|nr:P-loop NTPase [Leptolyngbya sp. BC1307]